MGVLLTALTDALLPPETTKQVLTTIARTLGHLYLRHHIFPGLPPGVN